MSGKFRRRVHGRAAVRVRKGMSCESNPTRSRHRSAASASRKAALTEMVAVDDREELLMGGGGGGEDKLLDDLNMDNMSLGGDNKSMVSEGGFSRYGANRSMVSEGGLSRYTTFTNCTNPTFDAVHKMWKSGSNLQGEVLAVLSAVAELIKEREGSETDVEYFAALLSTLETVQADETSRTAATAYLLSLIVKKISKEVLRNQFSKTVEVIYTKLIQTAELSDGAALKHLLSALGIVLRAQPAAVWNSATNRNMVVSVAALCTHEKPHVRTMSRRVVRTVLTDPVTSLDNGLHAAAAPLGHYLHQKLEASLSSKTGQLETTRYLCLLEGIMHKMPSNVFKQLAETVLKGFAFAGNMVKCASLQCIHRALQRQPCDSALTTEVNALLILSLRALAPSPSEIAVCAYWMQALVEAHVCLTGKDAERSYKLLGETMIMITKLLETANEQLCQIIHQVLSRLIEHCVQQHEESSRQLLALLEEALNLQTTLVWKYILRTMNLLFKTAGTALLSDELVKCLRSLAGLREHDQCFCKQDVEFTIGSAVRYIGVQHVLNVLSLYLDPDAPVLATDFRRSWLLPVLRVNIHNAPLSLFVKYFLPLAMKIHRRLPSLDAAVGRLYQVVQLQLWELLPSFTRSSCDFVEGFPQIAQVMGAALSERKDLRNVILSAIRSALQFALQPDAPAERVEVMSRYAKNYMPLLFNMYTNNGLEDSGYEDRGVRLSTLNTIRYFVRATPADLLKRYAENGIEKISTNTKGYNAEEVNRKSRIMDILAAITQTADLETVKKILDVVSPWFDAVKSPRIQKKAYTILDELLLRRGEADIGELFDADSSLLYNAVLKPYETVSGAARSAHQVSVRGAIASFGDYKHLVDFCKKAMDVTILCLDKANSMPCRKNASKCFQEMCSRIVEKGSENEMTPSAALYPLLERIYEMGSPTSGSIEETPMETTRACLVALNIVAQKNIRSLNVSDVSRLVSHGCSLLNTMLPQVRVLAIRLIRVLVTKMPEFTLSQYRELILSSFFSQPIDGATSRLRKANKLLLEALVDRFGVPVLEKYTDKYEWTQQMKNIEKARRRKERKASGEAAENESGDDDAMSATGSRASARTAGADTILQLLDDSDDEDGDEHEEMTERKSRTGSVWLREDGGDGDVINLLDRQQLIHKVTTTDPSLVARRQARLAAKQKEQGGFALSKDGKLIISMDDDDDEKGTGRKRKNRDDDLATLLTEQGKGEKRRRADSDDDDDDDLYSDMEEKTKKSTVSGVSRASRGTRVSGVSRATGMSGKSGYKTGGKGIHRDTTRPVLKAKRNVTRGDVKRKGQKLDPYTYVPLRNKKGQKANLKTLFGKGRKGGSTV